MTPPPLQAFLRPAASGGQRLYLHHTPPAGVPTLGALLYLPPWAEEMNKSRRMAALAARSFASAGWAVLQIDLLGCGDSSGDFADATWDAWLDDACEAAQWLVQQHPGVPLWLWGLRAGTLLSAATGARLPFEANHLLWQPATRGQTVLQQFLRIKAAADMASGQSKTAMAALRARIEAGQPVEVAGYTLSPGLLAGLQAATLDPPRSGPAPVEHRQRMLWLEVATQPAGEPGPAARTALAAWSHAGWCSAWHAVQGSPFWQTVEIEEAPALIDLSLQLLPEERNNARCGGPA
ncbi:hydrolase 2, exosortase A system-associated [Rubrivivax albus]|uniref:Hydrolase 2, exosortase A system-associated n=1 Tax=Rubrivivax albus TaxID=2499835 RepID=A0A3S2X313_9BURK|nr:hydrolase 2, exosortase A system-associated [Rubrivivax albus]RVT53471.1 hydrolase 2, exosortase A system-associated [Rubrivivax albus]